MSESPASPVPPLAESPALGVRPPLKYHPAQIFLLFLLAVIPFLPALAGAYIWDDDMWLVNNAPVHAWNGLRTIWNPWRQNLHFYPITFSTLWLEHKLWALNPLGYHAANIVFHALGAIALYLCLKRLRLRAAWLDALLWAIHPVQAESVSWVAEIKNVLSGIFFFLSALCYLNFALPQEPSSADLSEPAPSLARTKNPSLYALSLFLFTLALLTKTVTVVLPALLLILLWARGEKIRRTFPPLIPFFLVGLATAAFTAGQERRVMVAGGASNLDFSVLQRIIIAGKDVWFYLRTLLLPYPLLEIYPRWTYQTGNFLNYLPALGAALLALFLFALRHRITRWPFAIFACFVAALAPALGFINFFTMHYTFVADHYQYIASACLLPFVAELFARAAAPNARPFPKPFIVASTAILLLFMAGSAFYASLYQDPIRLWGWNVRFNPDAFTAQHNLGVSLLSAGRSREGLQHIALALQQAPDDDSIQRTVGKLALHDGKFDEALAHFNHAIELRPNYGESYVLRGDVYDRMGRLDDAIADYRKAIEVGLNDADGYIALAAALKKKGDLPNAAKNYELALGLEPGNMITRYNYGNVLLDLHRYNDAIAAYEFILHYQPDNPAVLDNLAYAYHMDGQDDKAIATQKRARALESATK
ncbi:MAG: tetratricopeptide repeat protein [Phycisphaerae bacterium]